MVGLNGVPVPRRLIGVGFIPDGPAAGIAPQDVVAVFRPQVLVGIELDAFHAGFLLVGIAPGKADHVRGQRTIGIFPPPLRLYAHGVVAQGTDRLDGFLIHIIGQDDEAPLVLAALLKFVLNALGGLAQHLGHRFGHLLDLLGAIIIGSMKIREAWRLPARSTGME